MIYRLLITLRLGRWLPRCAVSPPWRLADAGPCITPRGHEQSGRPDADWHADGQGYIWNADRWRWMGPPVRMEDLYDPLRNGVPVDFNTPQSAGDETP